MGRNEGVLISFFGSTNLGDLVLSDCLFDQVKDEAALKRLCFGPDPYAFADRIRHAPPSGYGKRIQQLRSGPLGFLAPGLEWFRAATRNIRHNDARELRRLGKTVRRELRSASFVLIGGGNMLFSLSDAEHPFFRYAKLYVRCAASLGLPVAFLSIGFGPFYSEDHGKTAAEILKNAAYVSFRDQKSLETYLKYQPDAANAFLAADPALLLERTAPPREHTGRTAAINFVSPYAMRLPEAEAKRVLEQCAGLVRAVAEIAGVELFSTDAADYPFLTSVRERAGDSGVSICYVEDLPSLLSLYARSDAVVAARMHSQIIACTQEKKLIGLIWQDKVAEFVSAVGNAPNSVGYLTLNGDDIRWICDRIREDRLPAAHIPDELKKQTAVNREIVKKLSQLGKR